MLDLDEVVNVKLTRKQAAACVIVFALVEGHRSKLDAILDEVHKVLETAAPVGVLTRVSVEVMS